MHEREEDNPLDEQSDSALAEKSTNQEKRRGLLRRLSDKLRQSDTPLKKEILESSPVAESSETDNRPKLSKELEAASVEAKSLKKGDAVKLDSSAYALNGVSFWEKVSDYDVADRFFFEDMAQAIFDMRVKNGVEPAISNEVKRKERLNSLQEIIYYDLNSEESSTVKKVPTNNPLPGENSELVRKPPYTPMVGATEILIGDDLAVVLTRNESFENNKYPSYTPPKEKYDASVISKIDPNERQEQIDSTNRAMEEL